MFALWLFATIIVNISCEDLLTTCQSRPTNLIQIEQTCETDVAQNETLLEKVQENIQTAVDHVKKMVNFAKSKLGFDSSDDPQVQAKKCDYYQCIFRKMNATNSNNYPDKARINQWIKENVNNTMIYPQVEKCFNELSSNDSKASTNSTVACEGSIKLMNCLDLKTICPVFKYP